MNNKDKKGEQSIVVEIPVVGSSPSNRGHEHH